MSYEISFPAGLIISTAAILVVWPTYQRKIRRIHQMPYIPHTLPAKGFDVPVLATFTGVKRLPRQISFSHNSLNPSFTLFENRLECRVVLKKAILFAEIEKIDIWDTLATRNLQVYVRGREDLFTANLFSRRNLARVLEFLVNRKVPLSARAQAFLSKNAA